MGVEEAGILVPSLSLYTGNNKLSINQSFNLLYYIHTSFTVHTLPYSSVAPFPLPDSPPPPRPCQVERCPCLQDQAVADRGRFLPDFSCDKDGNTECDYHFGATHCVRTALPKYVCVCRGGGCYSSGGEDCILLLYIS